jgi:NAD(P)-dependent dehydrogenase (short-subunit alcohol dehydrogenase family)
MKAPFAIVTGASRGLGFETARQLGRLGYLLVIASKNKKALEAAARALIEEGIDATPRPVDLASAKSISTFSAWASRRGYIDALINCAGVMLESNRKSRGGKGGTVLGADDKAVAQTLTINALGAWRLTKALASQMAPDGRIVNVSSGMGSLTGMESGYFGYRASKAALNVLTKTLAHEVAHRNVMVNSVCPGWVRTDMGGPDAPRDIKTGAAGIVWAATLPPGGPTGGFFRDGQSIAW